MYITQYTIIMALIDHTIRKHIKNRELFTSSNAIQVLTRSFKKHQKWNCKPLSYYDSIIIINH